ncbi:ASTRA-associated protein 1 [Paramyrothecium foliicola]|nr:ASTRA-associated protein 1 [Paramyrothecium foliicola]
MPVIRIEAQLGRTRSMNNASASGPPAPRSILRGHKAQVHAAAFLRDNERLATGDADGFVVLWDLTIMRPRAVWRAHENAILGVKGWGRDRIITHGRDHKLIVWRVSEDDEERLSTAPPLDDVPVPRPHPWIVHLLEVNTMNFCSFASCPKSPAGHPVVLGDAEDILLAVPNTLASEAIDIYELPSQTRIHTVKSGQQGGMAMSLALFHHEAALVLIAAFEDGAVSVLRRGENDSWIITYRSQPHSQPILSLDVPASREYFVTSAADSIIAKHPIPLTQQEVSATFDPRNRVIEEVDGDENPSPSLLSSALKEEAPNASRSSNSTFKPWEHPLKVINTKHSGQQSLQIRSDGKILATAGWDSNVRVYSAKTLKELAVLQWHTVGCYAIAFADVAVADAQSETGAASKNPSGSVSSRAPVVGAPSSVLVPGRDISVKDRRTLQAKTTHWIAAGAKDGKLRRFHHELRVMYVSHIEVPGRNDYINSDLSIIIWQSMARWRLLARSGRTDLMIKRAEVATIGLSYEAISRPRQYE